MKKFIGFCMGILVLTGCSQVDTKQAVHENMNEQIQSVETQGIEEQDSQDKSLYKKLEGTWKAELEDGVSMRITYDNSTQKLVASSKEWGFWNYDLKGYSIKDGKLIFDMDYKSGKRQYELNLKKIENDKLEGTYQVMLGGVVLTKPTKVCFERKSTEPIKEFNTDEHTYSLEERKKILLAYEEYKRDNTSYHFSYEVGEKTRDEEFIRTYQLDEITAGKQDVELMEVLLNWVCKECNHGNPEARIGDRDPASMMAFGKQNGEMNCYALSLLLSGTLRMYGVDARYVRCMPERSIFADCHVVVEAYSEKLNQWIMLDPTYNLMLQDAEGAYINLRTLRQAIISRKELIPNAEAAYNEDGFAIEEYITYMGKNCFRFQSAEKFYPGADIGIEGNRGIDLVPVGYEEPVEVEGYVITTDEERFFAPPVK